MRCPYCGYEDSKVIDTRPADEGRTIKKKKRMFKMSEEIYYIWKGWKTAYFGYKKDNRREEFDRSKILNGIIKACQKGCVYWADEQNSRWDWKWDL